MCSSFMGFEEFARGQDWYGWSLGAGEIMDYKCSHDDHCWLAVDPDAQDSGYFQELCSYIEANCPGGT